MEIPITIEIGQGESDKSYLTRVACAHGLRSWHDLVVGQKDLSDFNTLTFAGDHRNEIAEIVGRSEEDLKLLGYESCSRNYVRFSSGPKIQRKALLKNEAKVCPVCLDANGYADRSWDIAANLACQIHHVNYIDQCPDCGVGLSWRRATLEYCECGCDFRRVPVKKATLAERVSSIICSLDNDAMNSDLIPIELRRLELHERLNFIEFLAKHLFSGVLDSSCSVFRYETSRRREVLAKVYGLLLEWPERLFDALDERFETSLASANFRREAFGSFYLTISDRRSGLSFLLPVINRFLTERHVHLVFSQRGQSSGLSREETDSETLSSAAKRSNVGREKLRSLINDGVLVSEEIKAGKQVIHKLNKSDVDRCVENIKSPSKTAKRDALSSLLGFSLPVIGVLEKAGYIDIERAPDEVLTEIESAFQDASSGEIAKVISLRQAILGTFRKLGITVEEAFKIALSSNDLIVFVSKGSEPLSARVMVNHDMVRQVKSHHLGRSQELGREAKSSYAKRRDQPIKISKPEKRKYDPFRVLGRAFVCLDL